MELKQKQCQNWSPNLHEASVKVMQAIATRNISRPFRLDTGTAAYRSVPTTRMIDLITKNKLVLGNRICVERCSLDKSVLQCNLLLLGTRNLRDVFNGRFLLKLRLEGP